MRVLEKIGVKNNDGLEINKWYPNMEKTFTGWEKFQKLLKELYKEYNIPYIIVKSSDYEQRYLACQEIIKSYLAGKDNLQEIADSFV